MVELFEAVGRRGARPALTATSASGEVVCLNGDELATSVGQAAEFLRGTGVEPGTAVGIHLDNAAGLEALVMHWGAQWLGAVPVPLGTRLAQPEVDYIVDDAAVSVICSALGGVHRARAVADGRSGTRLIDCSEGLRALIASRPAMPAGAVTEHDVADVLYTSGTTGRPKGVELTHANNVAAGMELAAAVELTAGDVFQSAIPYFTSTGVHTNPLMCLVAGAHLVVEPRFDPRAAFPRAAAEGTTTYLGAPSMLALLLRHADASAAPKHLRHLVFGGSVMSAVALERLAEAFPGRALTNLYGQTEAGPGGTVCKPEFILDKAGSIGDRGAGPWTSFSVVDDAGRPARPGELGEIRLRSPAVMRGYRGQPDASADALAGGWLDTGDIGYVDDDGFLFYSDRRKDLIIRGGMNISSAEVESVLLGFPGVADSAVIPVDHDVLGEDVLAVVVAPDGVDTDALLTFARDRLADYKTPRHVVFVDELPRNAMGKVLKRQLRDDLGGSTR
jgi:acyl-CoA synthetase (AMP-forming)/AMP-acid ligase II